MVKKESRFSRDQRYLLEKPTKVFGARVNSRPISSHLIC